MHLAYSVVCLDGASDLTITASHIKVSGLLGVGVKAGAFDIALTGQTVDLARAVEGLVRRVGPNSRPGA